MTIRISKTERVVTERIVSFEISEEQAFILCKILGNIGGVHAWRAKLTTPLYDKLIDILGREEYDKFSDKHPKDIACSMYLQDSTSGECRITDIPTYATKLGKLSNDC